MVCPVSRLRLAARLVGTAAGLMLSLAASASAATYQATVGMYGTPGCAGSSYFASGISGQENCSIYNTGNGWSIYPTVASIGAGWTGQWQVNAPSGLTITAASISNMTALGLSNGHGWNAGGFWNGGSDAWSANATSASTPFAGIDSSYYGFKLYCYSSSCPGLVDGMYDASLTVPLINLTVEENQSPAMVAIGSDNLWYQGGNYVWNPSGDDFSAELEASDPSGVCDTYITVGPRILPGPSSTPDPSQGFQVCPSPVDFSPSAGAEVDTNQFVAPGSSGSFQLTLNATNAAGLTSSPSETIQVDNVQPSVALATPNDSNPGGWAVNHAVTVTAAAHTGPSGVSSLSCSVDGGAAKAYPSGGLSVNGNGKHSVSCTAANGAVGPQGQHNTGTSSMTIDIDEQSPTLTIEPLDPSDPDQVVVDTSDNESQVAGGQIEIAPKGTTNWTSIPTTFTGTGQLIGTIDDAGLTGPYTVQATACSQVGNCGSTSEALTMPLRLASTSEVSFSTIVDGLVAKKVKERVRVGWHWAAVLRHGKAVKVKRGGHYKKITVTKYVERCTHTLRRVGKHRWEVKAVCRLPHVQLHNTERVRFGKTVTVNGLLLSGEGVALAGVPVQILTAPDNGSGQYSPVTTVTTNSAGAWSATLPAGPSRVIEATYGGSPTILPASGQAKVTVPARVNVEITPKVVPWGSEIQITGQVLGGYVPTNSNLLRLNVGIGRIGQLVGLPTIKPDGQFVILWKFNAGHGVIHPWFSVGTLSEAAFPYAPGASRRVVITVGKRVHRRRQLVHKRHKLAIHRLAAHKHEKRRRR